MKNTLRFYAAIIRAILWVVILSILAIVLVQRISNNEKAIAGIRIFTVVTESMKPKYDIGDTIIVKEIEPSKLMVGDDITYLGKEGSFADKYITHRIIDMDYDETGKYTFKTQGIANQEPDPEIDETQVYGKVLYKTVLISKLNSITGNLYSMYFIIIIPMAIMTFVEFNAFGKKNDEEDEQEDEEENDDIDEKEENVDDRKKQKRKDRRHRRRKRKKE